MRIDKIDIDNLSTLYGIRGQFLGVPEKPVNMGAMLGVLLPGESTHYHAHHDHEIFIIHLGQGIMTVDHIDHSVNVGDKIYLLPGNGHVLKNDHPAYSLIFISIWWADADGALIPKQGKATQLLKKKHFIIAPPPTPNGDLHLGHLAGPYLGADILSRFLQQNLGEISYITGSDMHQSYVKLKADQLKTCANSIAEKYSNNIQQIFEDINAKPSIFYRPLQDDNYINFVRDYFLNLFNSGAIKVKEIDQAYCDNCQYYLHEAHLSGLCPHCASPCGGNSCETCGMPNSCTDIINAECKYCHKPPSKRTGNQICLVLEEYREALQKYLDQISLPSHIRFLIRRLMEKQLPNIPVAYPSEWGIAAPFENFENQKLCSWCEMAPAYIYACCLATNCDPDAIKNIWHKLWNTADTQITLFFGFDNSFFYTVLIPALLLAYTVSLRLPDQVIYNEFYLFEDKKFSKSRCHVVLAKDILAQVPSDCLRYYLAATRPEVKRTGFDYCSFVEVINRDLVDHLGAWITQLDRHITVDFNGVCPDGGLWCQEHDEFINYLQLFIEQFACALSKKTFSTNYAVELLKELVLKARKLAVCNLYLRGNHEKNKLEYQTGIVLELTAVKYYAIACNSIMPRYASQLVHALGLTPELGWENELRLLPKETLVKNLNQCRFQRLDINEFLSISLAS